MFKSDDNKNEIYLDRKAAQEETARGTLHLWAQVDKARMKMAANDEDGIIQPGGGYKGSSKL